MTIKRMLPHNWTIEKREHILDGDGNIETWATKQFVVLDDRTDFRGMGETIVEALRDAGLECDYTKNLRKHLMEMRGSAMTASALLELSGATEWEHPTQLHTLLNETIHKLEAVMANPHGELDPPDYKRNK